jgi:hypothetical protein
LTVAAKSYDIALGKSGFLAGSPITTTTMNYFPWLDSNNWLLLVTVSIIGVTALRGFFRTKKPGFGKFATSTLLLLLVVVLSTLLCAADKMQLGVFSNVLFAILGFAGGLFKGKENSGNESSQSSGKDKTNTKENKQ